MKTVSVKNIVSLGVFIALILSAKQSQAAKVYVVNYTDTALRIGIDGDAGCGHIRWDTAGLSGRKLTKENGWVEALTYCRGVTAWEWITLYVTNKNNQNKAISIPTYWLCHDYSGWGGCEEFDVVIMFHKNTDGQLYVQRARVLPNWDVIQATQVTNLNPSDYQ